jgi:hypothetical protein
MQYRLSRDLTIDREVYDGVSNFKYLEKIEKKRNERRNKAEDF